MLEGDVLLAYAGRPLAGPGDLKLKPAAPGGEPKMIPLRLWRDGSVREVAVAAGALGVMLDSRPVRAVVEGRRASKAVLLAMRSDPTARLPGTRREVEAVSPALCARTRSRS